MTTINKTAYTIFSMIMSITLAIVVGCFEKSVGLAIITYLLTDIAMTLGYFYEID